MNYTELKDITALRGSLNLVVSPSVNMRRPLSLSESCVETELNIERTTAFFAPKPLEIVETEPVYETWLVNLGLRFLFHITLISIFETVFFFLYISGLEDNGILSTINYFVSSVVTSCSNLTEAERDVSNRFLQLFLNTSQIAAQSQSALLERTLFNNQLLQRSWIYVGAVGGLFVCLAIHSRMRRISVQWKSLVLENIGLVALLAAYEFMFFTTIIMPFKPISAQEISENAILQIQSTCRLLL